ncbi:MAG: spheroidene monooxygenase [Chitinophagaceae bacterium]|nr:spheroidene monooxygenase [Chitinophagaceae bacterium]
MYVTLTIARYTTATSSAGIASMAFFRLPLFFQKKISFYKLLGCGKNGTFDKTPDLKQWGILTVHNSIDDFKRGNKEDFQQSVYGSSLTRWWRFFKCETWTLLLEPTDSHGLWDGKKVFGELPKNTEFEGLTAVLTRATIRVNKLNAFWSNVETAAAGMATAEGFITSLGVGEVPWIKQATFSVWKSKALMKQFAYKTNNHAEVIKKTRKENWYKEEMFTRFRVLASYGTLNGHDPLQGLL